MSGAVERYVAHGESVQVQKPRRVPDGTWPSRTDLEPSLTGREPTREERRVIRQGMIRSRQNEVTAQLELQAANLSGTLHETGRAIVTSALKRALADQDNMTDPREKAFMQQYDHASLNQLKNFNLGLQLTAMSSIDSVIGQPFDTEEPEPPLTFLELFLGRAFLGSR